MANSGFDCSEMQQFYNQVSSLERNYQSFLQDFLKEIGSRCLASTKKLTPVGKYEKDVAFYARKSLKAPDKGIGLVELNDVEVGTSGNLRRNWRLSEVLRQGDMLYIFLENPVEYASYVEYGHRVKGFNSDETVDFFPGRQMARISIDKIQQELPKRYKAAFRQFIAKLGGI